jgi:hypothetical protein
LRNRLACQRQGHLDQFKDNTDGRTNKQT